jgi:hypothetical protein
MTLFVIDQVVPDRRAMLGVEDRSSPNFVISCSVMLEGQRAAADHQDAVDVVGWKVIQPLDHRAKPGAIDTSGCSCRRSPAIANLGCNAGGRRLRRLWHQT